MTITVTRESGEWAVKHNGLTQCVRDTKSDAVEAGTYLARKWGVRLEVRRSNDGYDFGRTFEPFGGR